MALYCNAFIILLQAAIMISGAAARQFEVAWVPPAPYNDWAGKFLLLVNDSLVFKYNPRVDSVVRVSAEEYNSCSISNPIASYEGGNTVYPFSSYGQFYFVSGNLSSCIEGEKIIVDVLSPGSASPAAGPVKGHYWVNNVGCCRNKCCDGEFFPVCCREQT